MMSHGCKIRFPTLTVTDSISAGGEDGDVSTGASVLPPPGTHVPSHGEISSSERFTQHRISQFLLPYDTAQRLYDHGGPCANLCLRQEDFSNARQSLSTLHAGLVPRDLRGHMRPIPAKFTNLGGESPVRPFLFWGVHPVADRKYHPRRVQFPEMSYKALAGSDVVD